MYVPWSAGDLSRIRGTYQVSHDDGGLGNEGLVHL